VPGAHLRQSATENDPELALYDPGAQEVHKSSEPVVLRTKGADWIKVFIHFPELQAMHALFTVLAKVPASMYLPAWQLVHTLRPKSVAYVPAEHATHAVAEVAEAMVPLKH